VPRPPIDTISNSNTTLLATMTDNLDVKKQTIQKIKVLLTGESVPFSKTLEDLLGNYQQQLERGVEHERQLRDIAASLGFADGYSARRCLFPQHEETGGTPRPLPELLTSCAHIHSLMETVLQSITEAAERLGILIGCFHSNDTNRHSDLRTEYTSLMNLIKDWRNLQETENERYLETRARVGFRDRVEN